MKVKAKASVVRQTRISDGIFDLVLRVPEIAEQAVPGQFVNVYLNDSSKLLPRPISLCGIDAAQGTLRLVYRAGGEGTKQMALWKEGDVCEVLGPLGNGFPLEEAAGKTVYLVGGGIGVPPLLQTATELCDSAALTEEMKDIIADEEKVSEKSDGVNVKTSETVVVSVLGYRSDCFLKDEFDRCGETLIATEDGSCGVKGTVIDAMNADGRVPDVIFACGPVPMLRALKDWAAEKKIPGYISMEERMACGVGACLACVCKTKETDGHSHVNNTRVCKDGPVFAAQDIEL